MKETLKHIIALIKCRLNHVQTNGFCYFGRKVNIYNHGRILLHRNVVIRSYCDIFSSKDATLSIGEGCDIGNRARIAAGKSVTLGNYVLTGPNVTIIDYNHSYSNPDIPIMHQGNTPVELMKITIGDGTWIGANSVIVGKVNIGRNCVIGANSVVTKDIPDYCVANPIRIIKRYDHKKKEWITVGR